ncbi:hypothetical protein QZM80_28105, partial [Burkholderia multivorans]|nr:hypothetical protein [Burkholderia multivorans]
TWICIHCSFWSIASLCAQKADCTERWLRFTSREVAHYYFAPNTLFGTNNCSVETHSPRIRKLEKLADSYRRVANSIALLSEIDELLLDDAFQHSMPLQQQKKLMRQLVAEVDGLIGAMRQTPSGTSERFSLRLQGAGLLKQLGKLGVTCKINNDFQKIDQDDAVQREKSEGAQRFLPDLSQSMTLAMLCAMLVLFNNGQVVEWSYCRRLLLEGKSASR